MAHHGSSTTTCFCWRDSLVLHQMFIQLSLQALIFQASSVCTDVLGSLVQL